MQGNAQKLFRKLLTDIRKKFDKTFPVREDGAKSSKTLKLEKAIKHFCS